MPVIPNAVVGAVLAHGRDHDAIGKLEISEPDWGEQGTGHVARIAWEKEEKRGQDRDLPHRDKQPFARATKLEPRRRDRSTMPPCAGAAWRRGDIVAARLSVGATARSQPIVRSLEWLLA